MIWECKYCGENDEPKCNKCVREDGKIVSDELVKEIRKNPHKTAQNNKYEICCLGKSHPCKLNVNDGFCLAVTCQYQVKEK